jgi:hypothetical protein
LDFKDCCLSLLYFNQKSLVLSDESIDIWVDAEDTASPVFDVSLETLDGSLHFTETALDDADGLLGEGVDAAAGQVGDRWGADEGSGTDDWATVDDLGAGNEWGVTVDVALLKECHL